jgi:protein-tyrosine phosphatase
LCFVPEVTFILIEWQVDMIDRPLFESYWVEENRFLAGAYPGSYDIETTRRQMDGFLENGINTFIDLTHPRELAPYESILKERAQIRGMNSSYHRFAIRDHGVPSTEMMTNILDTMDEALGSGNNIYVHCWGGVGRTGITVGCYLVRHGSTNQQALLRVNELYKTRASNAYYPNSPETPEQIEFVRNWREVPRSSHKSGQNYCEG